MTALRALLFAVFGGFIGAAPAAPVVAGPEGAVSDAPQKSERPKCSESERADSAVAGAPPRAGGGLAAVPPAPIVRTALATAVAPAPVLEGRAIPPPAADVRAGLLDLPPPAR